jgi:Zn finger protein HypA/HybF involved in hydrogenase expression
MMKFKCSQCGHEMEHETAPVMCPTCNIEMTKVEEAAAPAAEVAPETPATEVTETPAA